MDETTSVDNRTLSPQTEVGDYRIIRCFASGGMGDLYEVVNPMLREFFAMKVLRTDSADAYTTEKSRSLFFNEARTTVRLRHSNIVTLHTMGVEPTGGSLYLVMDYVGVTPSRRKEILTGSGKWFTDSSETSAEPEQKGVRDSLSLDEVLATRGPIPEDILRVLALDIANALYHAHCFEDGVIHCDLKPSNILLRNDGHAVVTDFGIARAGRRLNAAEDASATGTTIYGTPDYMAPEQYLADGKISPQTDIYAFGVTVCRLLTGAFPIGDWDRPSELGLNGAWDELILNCIRREPSERWPSMAHIIRFLMDMPRYEARRRRKKLLFRSLIAALVTSVLILLGLIFAVLRDQRALPPGPDPTPAAFEDGDLARAMPVPDYSGRLVYGPTAPSRLPMPKPMPHVDRLYLSASVRELPKNFFSAFPRLENIGCDPKNPVFLSYYGILYRRDQMHRPYAVPPRLYGEARLPRSVRTFVYPWETATVTDTELTSLNTGAYGRPLTIRAPRSVRWELKPDR